MTRRPIARRHVRTAVARILEPLEPRQLLTADYFNIASGPLSQDWENADLITVDDNWGGVPSIEGYDGAGIGGGTTGQDPANFTAATPTGVLDVDANATGTPTGTSSGGVFEFALATPVGTGGVTTGSNTVAVQPSNAMQAPHLRFYVNSTGTSAVRVKYDLIDLDTGTSTNAQPFALQYRTSPTGTWTTAPGGTTADASVFANGQAGKVTTVNTLLPAEAAGVATLQLRVITANAPGNDQIVAIDNIVISSAAAPVGPGTLGFSPAAYTVPEAAGTVNVTVRRTGGTTGTVSANYTIDSGTAAAPGDFTGPGGLSGGTVVFADGVDVATIPITILNDTEVENAESFTLTLASPTGGATLGATAATVTITDNDIAGTFAFNPVAYTVNENAGTASLTVVRTGGTAGAVTLSYVTEDGTAVAGTDYTGTTGGTVTLANGATSGTITVPLINDVTGEPLEAFTVMLTGVANGNGAVVGANDTATVTINDDDTNGTLSFDPATYSALENSGTVVLTVRRTGGTSGSVSANYALVNGTATAGSDVTGPGGVNSGTVTFASGSDAATITLTLVDDALTEGNEQLTVVLSNPTGGAAIGTGSATLTIVDDEFTVPTGLLINELFIDPPSFNQPFQYVELRGTPGTVLSNVYLLQIEGDAGAAGASNPGSLDQIIDLSGAVIGSNGLLFVKAADGGFTAQDPATGVFETATLNGIGTDTGFEITAATFLLVFRAPTGEPLPALDADLDADNAAAATPDFGLEGLPDDLVLLDGIGNATGAVGSVTYTSATAPLGASSNQAADAIVRFNGDATAFSAASFYYGFLDAGTSGTGSQTLTFSSNPLNLSANFPRDEDAGNLGLVTPGGANVPAPDGDVTPPTVVSATFNAQQGQRVVVTFSENVGASLTAGDFTLTNTTTGTAVQLVLASVSADGTTATLTFANTGGLTQTVLRDGNYTLRVNAGAVADAAGNALAADSDASFSFLNADFDVSGGVRFADLVRLAQNYNTASGATFAQGDANYDGAVNFADLVALAQRYNTGGPSIVELLAMVGGEMPPAPVAPVPAAPVKSAVVATKKPSVASDVLPAAAAAPAKGATFNTARRIA